YLELASGIAVGVSGVIDELEVAVDAQGFLHLVLQELSNQAVRITGGEEEGDFRKPLTVRITGVGQQLLRFRSVKGVLLAKLGIEARLSGRDPTCPGNANALQDAIDEALPINGCAERLADLGVVERRLLDVRDQGKRSGVGKANHLA